MALQLRPRVGGHRRASARAGERGARPGDPTNRFYRVLDTVALGDALAAVASGVQECIFELNGTVSEPYAGTGTVLLGGKALAYQNADGWHMVDANRISIDGAACKAIQSGAELRNGIGPPRQVAPRFSGRITKR